MNANRYLFTLKIYGFMKGFLCEGGSENKLHERIGIDRSSGTKGGPKRRFN